MWGGRFTGATDPEMERFNASIGFDKRLWAADIDGSIAYAIALERCKLLTTEEAATLVRGLEEVRRPAALSPTPASSPSHLSLPPALCTGRQGVGGWHIRDHTVG